MVVHTHMFRTIEAWLASVIALAVLALAAVPVQAAPFDNQRDQFADVAFQQIWERTDAPQVRAGRTFYWGPLPWWDYAEFYRQSPNGLRTVQYFDKARMEINNPANRTSQNGVTNGLLVVELVSGQLKWGDDGSETDGRRGPAPVPVAGDPPAMNPSAPTYASFAGVATTGNGYRDPNRLGQAVAATIDRAGNISERSDLARPETRIVQYSSVTGHNIPRVFWDFMNRRGPTYVGGRVGNGPIVDWLFAMGLPITDPYWVRARVGGAEKDVLVQLFERRALTYTPGNPPGYEVEMGNVGQHYFQWRYPHLGQPWAVLGPADPNLPVAFAVTNVPEGPWQIAIKTVDPGPYLWLTNEKAESVAYSYLRSFDLRNTRLLLDSRRGNGQNRQIYSMEIPPLAGDYTRGVAVTRLTYSDGTQPPGPPFPFIGGAFNDYNPSASPDGTKIAFVSDRLGTPTLFMMYANGEAPVRIGISGNYDDDGCIRQTPTWGPNGRRFFWEQKCGDGRFAVMTGELAYEIDANGIISVNLTNIIPLTDQGSDNRYPRVSPDGGIVAFTSWRDGNAEIYYTLSAGGPDVRLTADPAEDEAAAWSPDGQRLAFASTREGGVSKVFVMNADGSGVARLTGPNSDTERWAAWAQ